MTWFYCANCLIATFAPIALYSKASGIGFKFSVTSHWKTFFCFLATYFVKFLLIATVSDGNYEEGSSVLSDLLMSIAGLFDVMVMFYLVSNLSGSVSERIQFCAIGWTYAIAFASKLFPIFTYSRAPQSDMYWLLFGLKSIPQIFYYISFFYAVFMALNTKSNKLNPFTFFYMLFHLFYPTLLKIVTEKVLMVNGWIDLLLDTLLSFSLYTYSQKLFESKRN